MYIQAFAINSILSFILGNSSRDSSLIFDFTYPDVVTGDCERTEAVAWFNRAHEKNEPLRFGIDPDKLEEFMSARGFSDTVCVGCDFFEQAYFTGIHKDRKSTPILSIAHAKV